MEKLNEINYICARWRDANTDPPPLCAMVMMRKRDSGYVTGHRQFGGDSWIFDDLFYPLQPGDQWLDVTDEPAIPRAQVQAAACSCPVFVPGSSDLNNRIMLSEMHHAEPYGQPPWKFCPWCGGMVWQSVNGVTPSEDSK